MKWQHGVSGVVNGGEIDTLSHARRGGVEKLDLRNGKLGKEERLEGGFTSRGGNASRGYIRFSPCRATRNSISPLKTFKERRSPALMD